MEDAGSQGLKIVHELKVNARAAGPRLGKQVQFAIKRPRPVPGTSMPRPVLRSSRRRTARLRWRPANTS